MKTEGLTRKVSSWFFSFLLAFVGLALGAGGLRADGGVNALGAVQQLEQKAVVQQEKSSDVNNFREDKSEEGKITLRFKEAPLKEVLDAVADAFGFYYVIQYPDFNSEVFLGAKEVVFEPTASVSRPGARKRTTGPGFGRGEEPDEDDEDEVDSFNPGFEFENRKISFYVSEKKENVKKVVDVFCSVADVDCEYDDQKRLLKVKPYRVEVFDYGFFMNYSISNSIGLGGSTGSGNVGIVGGSGGSTTTGGTAGGTVGGSTSSSASGVGGSTGFGISENYKDFVFKVLAGFRSREGRVFVSNRGYIVVIDRPSAVERMKRVWEREVKKQEPVLLNVKVIRVDLEKGKETGVDWNGVISKVFGGNNQVFTFSAGFAGSISQGLSFTYDSSKLHLLLRALQDYGNVRVVYDWSVKARNGIPVVFADIQSVPYVTQTVVVAEGTSEVATSPAFVDVGLKINMMGSFVKKCRKKDVCVKKYEGQIFVSISDLIKLENLGTDQNPYFVPNVKFSSAVIPFDLRSNESIVITSFKTARKEISKKGIPILMNLPLFGGLFRYTKNYSGVSEFVIVVTPFFESDHLNAGPEVIYKNKNG